MDINPEALKILELSHNGRTLTIHNSFIEKMPRGAMVDHHIRDERLIMEVIESYQKKYAFHSKDIVLAMPTSLVMSQVVYTDNTLNAFQLQEQVYCLATEFLPYSLEEVTLDFTPLSISEYEAKTAFLVIAVRKEHLSSRLSILEKTALHAKIVDVESYAWASAGQFFISKDLVKNFRNSVCLGKSFFYVLLYLSTPVTTLIIYNNEQVISYQEVMVEQLEHKEFSLEYCQKLIESLLQKLFLKYAKQNLAALLLAGTLQPLKKLCEPLGQMLNIPCQVLEIASQLNFAQSVNALQFEQEQFNLLTCLGLAFRAASNKAMV